MCLIILNYQPDQEQRLTLLSNRDEFYQRETLAAGYWSDYPDIYGGIDCVAGGSWLSIDKKGRLAAVTNIRKPPFTDSTKASRGDLIKDFLSSEKTALDFIAALKTRGSEYNLFNLLLLDNSGLWHYSNDSQQLQPLEPGIHGLSNASLNTPWPKVKISCQLMDSLIAKTGDKDSLNESELFNILQSQQTYQADDLPDTGIGEDFERLLSSAFIRSDDYGTRSSTLIKINKKAVFFKEFSFDANGKMPQIKQQTIPIKS